jgi:hypothetical protein
MGPKEPNGPLTATTSDDDDDGDVGCGDNGDDKGISHQYI